MYDLHDRLKRWIQKVSSEVVVPCLQLQEIAHGVLQRVYGYRLDENLS